jgi:hypothetical protein
MTTEWKKKNDFKNNDVFLEILLTMEILNKAIGLSVETILSVLRAWSHI